MLENINLKKLRNRHYVIIAGLMLLDLGLAGTAFLNRMSLNETMGHRNKIQSIIQGFQGLRIDLQERNIRNISDLAAFNEQIDNFIKTLVQIDDKENYLPEELFIKLNNGLIFLKETLTTLSTSNIQSGINSLTENELQSLDTYFQDLSISLGNLNNAIGEFIDQNTSINEKIEKLAAIIVLITIVNGTISAILTLATHDFEKAKRKTEQTENEPDYQEEGILFLDDDGEIPEGFKIKNNSHIKINEQ